MNGSRREEDADCARRRYLRDMATSATSEGRAAEDLDRQRRARLLDVAIALVVAAATAVAAWHGGLIGDRIHGPIWLRAAFPLLLAGPLLWRRTRPLAAFTAMMVGVVLQALVSGFSPEGLELIAAWAVGPYSVAAYGTRRAAFAGLAIAAVGYAVYAAEDANIQTGKASELWAGAFFALMALASWLVGLFVRSRRDETVAHARATRLERDARNAVADERARMARELHDIVSHNLSVVVVQAAGARAQHEETDVAGTLEKIEQSGRDALIEMRRLLGVLRSEDDAPSYAPQPGLGDLPALVETVGLAGLPVTLDVGANCRDIPPTTALSTYRVVQEALTNALKHARATGAHVTVRRNNGSLAIDVADDGAATTTTSNSSGFGLIGMEERVKLLGGSMHAGPLPDGGFGVHVELPVSTET